MRKEKNRSIKINIQVKKKNKGQEYYRQKSIPRNNQGIYMYI